MTRLFDYCRADILAQEDWWRIWEDVQDMRLEFERDEMEDEDEPATVVGDARPVGTVFQPEGD